MENQMDEVLLEMERFRQDREHESIGNPDWHIRVCQAIVAKAAGYKDRTDWSGPMFEQVQEERKAKGTWEMQEGARIYYTGDCMNASGYGVIEKVKQPNEYSPLRFDILMDDGRSFPAIFENEFKPSIGRRFWLADEYHAHLKQKTDRMAKEMLKRGA
jgi:hypothetical protein